MSSCKIARLYALGVPSEILGCLSVLTSNIHLKFYYHHIDHDTNCQRIKSISSLFPTSWHRASEPPRNVPCRRVFGVPKEPLPTIPEFMLTRSGPFGKNVKGGIGHASDARHVMRGLKLSAPSPQTPKSRGGCRLSSSTWPVLS